MLHSRWRIILYVDMRYMAAAYCLSLYLMKYMTIFDGHDGNLRRSSFRLFDSFEYDYK